MDLKGKNVLVTGAAKRIGAVIARHFADRGANILLHCHRSRNEAEKLAKQLRKKKVRTRIYSADLTDMDDTRRMCREILKDVRVVDVLVNSASIFYPIAFAKIEEKNWDDVLSIHLKAPFFLAQALAPAMKKKGAGRIINIADWAALRPYKDFLPYCVSKAGLITMTQALARTLAPEILVTAICPGAILPPPWLKTADRRAAARKILVGHWGRPEDIARAAVFLAEQDFITGSYHLVDGGEFLKGF
ncbi:MAG TPA: SDR family NAD(P)-dependent oxidoreductase [bacterium]|nr:SDR family NAD(P)-dependent oxidoreductase [bacterium]